MTIAGTVFCFCAFWVYHFLDLDIDSGLRQELHRYGTWPVIVDRLVEDGAVAEGVKNIVPGNPRSEPVEQAVGDHGISNANYYHSLISAPDGLGR